MKINFLTLTILIIFLLFSCTKETTIKSQIKEKSQELQVLEAYKEGVDSLEKGDVLYAAKKFNEAELIFHNLNGPQ